MANVEVSYFAQLKEWTQKPEERCTITPGQSALDLYHELSHRYGFQLSSADVRVAVNEEYASWDTALRGGESVVFIPPVSGG